ncbi:MAG: Do family serine endopeptidase [Ignavibacteria bacterium]|nr:Do family serine endopeptidase [Ignavibacteria bacterium]
MSTKSVVVAILLISLGIVLGVTLVSTFKGVDMSFATQDVKIGAQSKSSNAHPALKALNEAYQSIAKEVTPTVVYITVVSRSRSDDQSDSWFRFFGPDFRIEPRTPRPEVGAGSGVILTSDGYILTNNHVVGNAVSDGIEVTLSDKRVFKNAKLIGTDKYTDLAVIKVNAKDLVTPRLGNSDEVEVGQIAFAFGNPLGLTSTMTQGIISATGRGQLGIIAGELRDRDDASYSIENFIQTDAAVNPGNSGGALVNINGEVIGINTAIATTNARFQGYSFAIPINLAKKVATDLIKYGKVRRGYIGVVIETVDATMAKAKGLDKPTGVLVQRVNAGSAGEAAGVKAGDIILTVDGREVKTSNELQTIVAAKYPGETVTLKILRDGKMVEKKVVLKARDEDEEAVASADTKREPSKPREAAGPSRLELEDLGMTVRNLDSDLKKSYETESGVLVESVKPLSEAQKRQLRPNDVILSVGEQPVTSVSQFEQSLRKKNPGDAVLMRVKGADKSTRFVAVEIPQK